MTIAFFRICNVVQKTYMLITYFLSIDESFKPIVEICLVLIIFRNI